SAGVGASQTVRRSPCFVGTTLRSAQLKTLEGMTGLPAGRARATPATKAETADTTKSRRVIIRAFRRESEVKSSGNRPHRPAAEAGRKTTRKSGCHFADNK